MPDRPGLWELAVMEPLVTPNADRSRRDEALDVVVRWVGWLLATVAAVGCARGWWWGGDLENLDHLPVIGESVAVAAVEQRGWPWVPLLVIVCSGVFTRRAWLFSAGALCGAGSQVRHRRARFAGARGR